MSTKSAIALAIMFLAVIAVVVEAIRFEDGGDWEPLARVWVTRTYAAIAAVASWWLARSGGKLHRNRAGIAALWVCRGAGAVGAVWLAFMLYAAVRAILVS